MKTIKQIVQEEIENAEKTIQLDPISEFVRIIRIILDHNENLCEDLLECLVHEGCFFIENYSLKEIFEDHLTDNDFHFGTMNYRLELGKFEKFISENPLWKNFIYLMKIYDNDDKFTRRVSRKREYNSFVTWQGINLLKTLYLEQLGYKQGTKAFTAMFNSL